MRQMITSAGLLVALVVSLCSAAPVLVKGGERILFVGNNMIAFPPPGTLGGLDSAVRSVLATGGINVTTEHSTLPFAGELDDVWMDGLTADKISSGKYDYVVLMGWCNAETWPNPAGRDTFFDAVKSFDKVITASGGKTMLYMTYTNAFFAGRPDLNNYLTINAKTAENYVAVSKLIGNAPVAPVGLVFSNIAKAPPAGKDLWVLYEPYKPGAGEEPHGQLPGNYGQLLGAYVFYMVLTGGKSPIGLKQQYCPTADPKIDSMLQFRADSITGKFLKEQYPTAALRQGGPAYPAAGARGRAPSLFLLNGSNYCPAARGTGGGGSCVFIRSERRSVTKNSVFR